jgi:hypothetical protein
MNESLGNSADWRMFVSRSLAIWIVLMLAEITHGILRAILLVPWVGEFRSNQIGVFTGSVIILVIVYFTIRWIGATGRWAPLVVGAIWLMLTVAFEVLFGRLVVKVSWERIASDYNLLQGGMMPIGLLILFFSPLVALMLRKLNK